MIGGFMGVGTPERLMDELVRQGKRDLTVIANDNAHARRRHRQAGQRQACVKKTIVSHIGLNPETQKKMLDGAMEVELVPQGTLIERIRAGGYGLGGILTPTGVGTLVEEGKRKIEVDGKEYLLETALRADFALVQAFLCDYSGNLTYALTARNFNPMMAMAAETVIVEAEHIVPVGVIPPDHVDDAGAARRLRDRSRVTAMDAQTIIAKRIAQELRDGMLVNLGIGIPTLVANYVPAGMQRVLPVGERPDRHRPDARGRHGAAPPDRCRRPAGNARCRAPARSTARCRSA